MLRMFKLDNRLEICARMVSKGASIIDVGSDHAYLPIWLVANKIVPKATASDINDGPLQRAEFNIKRYGLTKCINLLKSDGLCDVSSDIADEIIIAGMGGELISKIISQALWIKTLKKRLILQPMSSEEDLRRYLGREGFFVQKEIATISKKRVYVVMSAVYTGKEQVLPIEYPYIGKLSENVNSFSIRYMKGRLKDIHNRLKGSLMTEAEGIAVIEKIQNIIDSFKEN